MKARTKLDVSLVAGVIAIMATMSFLVVESMAEYRTKKIERNVQLGSFIETNFGAVMLAWDRDESGNLLVRSCATCRVRRYTRMFDHLVRVIPSGDRAAQYRAAKMYLRDPCPDVQRLAPIDRWKSST